MSNKQPSIELCAADCGQRPECSSFEWSATSKICSLNKVAQPTLAAFEDYILCQRKAPAARPERPKAEAVEAPPRCPAGYEILEGDVPGWDQFGRGTGNKKDSLALCVADCEEREECLSLEWSPSSKTCSLNKVATPTAAGYQDFTFCKRRREDPPTARSLLLKREGATEDIVRPASGAKEAAPPPPAATTAPPEAPAPAQAAESAPAPAAQAAQGSEVEDAGRSGCPQGYVFAEGDVKGGDQFGRDKNRRNSLEQCAADCNRKIACKSLEWSPSKKSCNLNKVVGPVEPKYKDYILCLRSTESLEAPATPIPAPAAELPAPAPAAPATPAAEPQPAPAVAEEADANAVQAAPEAPEQPDPGEANVAEAGAAPDGEEAAATAAAPASEGAPQEATAPAEEEQASGAPAAAVPAQEVAPQEADADEGAVAGTTTAPPSEATAGAEAEVEPQDLAEAALPQPAATEAEGKAAATGNPECWIDGYTFDSCCNLYFGASGNANCWDGAAFTYGRCCFPKDAPPSTAAPQSLEAPLAPSEPPPPALPSSQPAPLAAPPPPMVQPVPLQPPRPQAPYQVGDLVEVADAEGGNPLTAWLPGVVLAKSEGAAWQHRQPREATYGVRLAVTADGSNDAVLSGVPAQMLRKADAQHHAVAQERLSREPALRAQAVKEVTHEVAEIQAAAQAVHAAAASVPQVQPVQLAQAGPSLPSPLAAPAPLPAQERRALEVGDFAEVKLLGPPSEGRPGVWLACTISGANDAPHAYDVHFLSVPQAQREVLDVPSYMVRKVDSKEYSNAMRRMREDPVAASQAVVRLRTALGQKGDGVSEGDGNLSGQTDESAKIRAAWDARKSGAKDRRHREEEQKRIEGERRLEDAEREQAVAEARKQEQRKAALAAKRQAAQEARRRADEEAKAEALRQEKEELKQKLEEEVRLKVDEELKKRKADEDATRRAQEAKRRMVNKATAELRRKKQQAEQEAAAAKEAAAATSGKEGGKGAGKSAALTARPAPAASGESTSLKAMAQDGDSIRLRVRDLQGHSVQVKVGRRMKLRVLINTAADRLMIPRETVFAFNGMPLKLSDTAEALGLHEQDLIEARY